MSEPKNFATTLQTANQNTEKLLWLFGFRIDSDTEIPNLYTLIVYGEQEPPWEHPTFAVSINTQTIVWLS
ncbi:MULTISPECIES: hypothetical protein [unclassified Microcoleus]|uniref:hypothetical protein n=1 Tax=unclassified Microcoleus TaxID=2642155 RepID=UPI002FCF727C